MYLGPFIDDEAGTKLIRVRRTCYTPPSLRPNVSGRANGPKSSLGDSGECRREAGCLHCPGRFCQEFPYSIRGERIAPLHAPLADRVLLEHPQRILERDLPASNQALPRLQKNAITTQLGRLVANNQASRKEADLRRIQAEEKPLSDLIGDQGVAQLLRMANVRTEEELPEIWRSLT